MIKRIITLTALLLTASVLLSMGAFAEDGDSFADLPNRSNIIFETTNWNLEQSTRLDVTLDCGEYLHYADSEENYIIEVPARQGSTATVSSALFNCIKNGRHVISNRDARPYIELYVPASSDASLVTLGTDSIYFNKPGEVSVILKYEHANLHGTATTIPRLMVRFDFVVEESAEARMELFSTTDNQKIENLEYTFGSFNWEGEPSGIEENIYKSLKMVLHFPCTDENTLISNAEITLPDGFSFNKDKIVSSKMITLEKSESGLSGHEIIYPIYSNTIHCKLSYVFEGASGTLDFPVNRRSAEGLILMRPTTNVNQVDNAAFCLPVEIDPVEDFVTGATNVYSNRLAILGCTLSQSVYNKNGLENDDTSYIQDSLENLGFSRITYLGSIGDHDVASTLALKRIVHDGEIYNTVIAVIRGTVATEWIGNFNITGDSDTLHNDFALCADSTQKRITEYIDKTLKLPSKNLKLYLCGHSRAGAVVDLVAHNLNIIYDQDNVSAYTFAAPNSTKNPVADANIFNYVYKYDLVGFVPQGGYGKHGITLVVGGDKRNAAPATVKDAFKTYTNGTEYKGVGNAAVIRLLLAFKGTPNNLLTKFQKSIGNTFAKPSKFSALFTMWLAKGHGAENYCAWVVNNGVSNAQTMLNCLADYYDHIDDNTLKSRIELGKPSGYLTSQFGLMAYEDGYSIIGVGCPVDIDIYDASGELAVQFHAHEETIINDDYFAFGDGETSYITIPSNSDYTVVITGTGEGTLNYDYACLTEEGEAVITDTVAGVPVHTGEVFRIDGSAAPGYTPVLVSGTGIEFSSDSMGKMIYLPEDLVRIEDEAFSGTAAHTIIIPDSCVSIGERAFADSSSLRQLVFTNGDGIEFADNIIENSESVKILAPDDSEVFQWAQSQNSN